MEVWESTIFFVFFGVGIRKSIVVEKKRGFRFGEFREFRWLHVVGICFRKNLRQQVPFSLTMHQVIFKRWHNATPSISQVCEFLFFKDPHRKFGTKNDIVKLMKTMTPWGWLKSISKPTQLVRGSLNLRPTWKKSCYHGNLRAPHPMLAYFSQKIRPMLRGLLRDNEG